MQKHLQAIITILSLVNPVVCGAIFAPIVAGRDRHAQFADATKAAAAVLVILSFAALCGTKVLDLFGISLDAFSVAGGGVLAWIGFLMLSGSSAPSSAKTDDAGKTASLSPLILFAASPGTITGVITLAAAHVKDGFPITALVAVVVATVVMWFVIVLMARTGGGDGGFVRDIVTRFMGLIVIAMGVQFALTGYRGFMAPN